MNRRNWLDLARKLVDQYDMDYTLGAIQSALGQQALGFFGEGVLITTQYPSPFPITMSGVSLGGSVGNGIAYDPNGQLTQITPPSTTPKTFTILPNTSGNPRWDLLVLTYQMTGQVPVPKPSDPIATIDLNLVDDFALFVREGVPSGAPAYPAKEQNDIILAGLQVPNGATFGTDVNVDLTIRENAQPFLATMPVFIDETPAGAVNGVNQDFTLSAQPQTAQSALVFLDSLYVLPSKYSLAGTDLHFFTAPAIAQKVTVWYIENSPSSENPLAGINSTLGIGDGVTTAFALPGSPPNKSAITVYLDGTKVAPADFTFTAGSPNSQIQFSVPPPIGADLGAFYLVNSTSVGSGMSGVQSVSNEGTGTGQVAIGITGNDLQLRNIKQGANVTVTQVGDDIVIASSGGGGGGEVVPQGNEGAPITVDPLVGITPTTDPFQSWYLKGQTGNGRQTVTAAPQIAAGTFVGQRLAMTIVNGADYPVFNDGAGLSLNGVWPDIASPIPYSKIELEWTGLRWSECSRR